ncbi:hypothetical protein CON71_34270 [Bacillus thuringiensis]|uniref:BclA C-terminal domain-containing protein n=1 Tax=Bacillus thuringiensis TaxID=1428 RepID=A0A9X6TG14_BACTU|nr:hypothetical protein CON71_34270 [Bacillus thuringiensis]
MTNSGTVTVNNNAAVPLTTNVVINGTAITHVPGSTDIMLAPNQTYWIFYEASSGVGTGTAQLEFHLNGAIVPGTQTRATNQPSGSTTELSTGAILNTGAGPNILTLVNTAGGARDILGSNVNIIKLQ